MKKYAVMFCAMLAMGALTVSCSSEDEAVESVAQGEGAVKISLNTGTDFQSRAITESDYTNLANYTVQILKDGKVVQDLDGNLCEWKGNEIPDELIKLSANGYQVLAFTGEAYKGEDATTAGMYVEGSTTFNVGNNQVESVAVTCTPQCARVTVNFDAKMAEYFNDYYVVFTGTKALGEGTYTWEKDKNADPVYMAVSGTEKLTATIRLVDKENKIADDIEKTYEVSPGKAWKLNIVPSVQGGQLGITIEIDGKTDDYPIDIEIPSDWL